MARKLMTRKQDEYTLLEKKLLVFFRKYYLIQIVQGLVISLIVAGVGFLALIVINDSIRPGSEFRKISLFLLGGIFAFAFLRLVLFELLAAFRLRSEKKLFYSERVIRSRFPDIQDTLINLIELGQMGHESERFPLILASIDERIKRLKPFDFNRAIPYKKILWPVVAMMGSVLIYVLLIITVPEVMRSGYSRTVHYTVDYDYLDRISLALENDSLKVGMGQDFVIKASAQNNREHLPLTVKIGETIHPMEEDEFGYTYTIPSVNGPVSFTLLAGDYQSADYRVEVIPLPELNAMSVTIIPPVYTRLLPKTTDQLGDLVLAQGSVVQWTLDSKHTDEQIFYFDTDTVVLQGSEDQYDRQIYRSQEYRLFLRSFQIREPLRFDYRVEVIPDKYPMIEVNQESDSISANQVFFQANIADDYGFHRMDFVIREAISLDTLFLDTIGINQDNVYQRTYYGFDFDQEELSGADVEYFFTIWDNDEINGYKPVSSKVFRKMVLSTEDLFRQNREEGEQITEDIRESSDLIRELKEKVGDLMNNQIIDNKEEWEIKNQMDEITEMKSALEEMINNIQQENQRLNERDEGVSPKMRAIAQKQKQIEALFEKLMDEELKALFKEFEELAKELNKKNRIEKTQEIESNLDNLERQLDMNLELLQKLEMSKEIMDISEQMQELSESVNEEMDSVDNQSVKERYEELDKRYEKQLEKNAELKKPDDLQSLEQEREQIKEDLEEDEKEKKQTDAGGDKESSEEQKKRQEELSQQMEDLSQKLAQQVQTAGGGPSDPVDLETLRQLSRQLNDYSFKQEELLKSLENYNARSKRFHEVGAEQLRMALKFNIMRDSLVSLGYKQPMIAALINEQVFHVETSLKNLDRSVQEGNLRQVRYEQQKIMEGANELAVRLDELLDNIQAMSGKGQGQEKFTDSNPKDAGDQVQEMKEMQQSLKEQMKSMVEQMKKGNQSGQTSEELVKMLSEREQLRKALEELRNNGNLGNDTRNKLNDAQRMMEEVEKDIIYNKVSDQTISKEEWIQTRLLEAEKAERERDQEDKRVAEEFKGTVDETDLPRWKELERETMGERRTIQYSDIKLKEYYRLKYQSYLKKINK